VGRSLVAAVLAWALLAAAPAAAAPPINDNYLSSMQMTDGDGVAREWQDTFDTSEATTQADLFNPNREGLPFGGAGPETTSCGSTAFGRTVWWDFLPEISGGAQIQASGSFDAVVAVYEYDVRNPADLRPVLCQNTGLAEDVLLPEVEGGRAYTVQVGGVGGAGGPLDFRFFFFGDRDEDGVLDDQPDRCVDLPGISGAGGCPPRLRSTLSLEWAGTAAGLQFTRAIVRKVPRGARVQVRCRRCGLRSEVRRGRGGSVRLRRLAGRTAPAGAVLELFVTQKPRGRGRYRHGAIGTYLKYRFDGAGISKRTTRCLQPGSRKPRRRCG
jgi:hypothetical protein